VATEELSKFLNRVASAGFDQAGIYLAPGHFEVNAKSKSDLR
jgi:hypothetical protein